MADRSLAIRLSLKDADAVRQGLERLGRDGEQSLKRINTALAGVDKAPGAHLRLVSDASRELQGSAAALASNLPVAGRALAGLGPAGVLAAGALGGVALVTKKAIDAAEEYGAALARNQAILRATGYAAGLTADQIGDLAQEIQDTTLASDKAVLEAAAALQTYGAVSGEQFKQTLRLAQDLSAVMGGDVRSSAQLLGKALADPEQGMQALRRAGILFTGAQKDAIKALVDTGDRAGAVGAILGELEKKVGGAGTGERRGIAGATKTLADAWDDLLKEWGRTPALMAPIIGALDLMSAGIKKLQAGTLQQQIAAAQATVTANTGGAAVSPIAAAAATGRRGAAQGELNRLTTTAAEIERDKGYAGLAAAMAAEQKARDDLNEHMRQSDEAVIKKRLADALAAAEAETRAWYKAIEDRKLAEFEAAAAYRALNEGTLQKVMLARASAADEETKGWYKHIEDRARAELEADAKIRASREQLEQRDMLAKAQAQDEETRAFYKSINDNQIKGWEKAAKERARITERGTDEMVDIVAQGWQRLTESGQNAFSDVFDFARSTAQGLFAQIASEQLIRPAAKGLMESVTGGLSSMLGMAGPWGAAASGAVALGGLALSSLFGGKKENRHADEAKAWQAFAQASQQSIAAVAEASGAAASLAASQAQAAAQMADQARRAIAELRGDTAGAFALLNEDNQARVAAARAVGGEIEAIETQNALLRRDWLKRLTDTEFELVRVQTTALEQLDRLVQTLRSDLGGELAQRIAQAGQQASATAQAAAAYRGLAQSLGAAAFDLRGGDLSTASPAQKLAAQRAEFERLSAAGAGGDREALAQLPEAGRAFLEASRAFNATTTAYAEDFAKVQAGLTAAAADAGTLATEADRQAALLDINEKTLKAIEATASQAEIDSNLLEAQLATLRAIEATLSGTRRIVTTARDEAVDQTVIQDILKNTASADLSKSEAILTEVASTANLTGSSIGKLTELIGAVRDQQEAEARERAERERREAEERARIAALNAQKQALVSNQRQAQQDASVASNVSGGGILISSTGSGAGGQFVWNGNAAAHTAANISQVVNSLNYLIGTLGLSISEQFSSLSYVNTTVNPKSIFNQLLSFIGLAGFAGGGVMTSSGPLPLNRYAGGGIANSPQLALFGEGGGSEAYVPLPDGRRIPVALQMAGNNDNGAVVSTLRWHAGFVSQAIVDELRAGFADLSDRLTAMDRTWRQAILLGRQHSGPGGGGNRVARPFHVDDRGFREARG